MLSTGNNFSEVNLIDCHTTLIIGNNGVGKSLLLDALSFGLYGRPFRKINKHQLVNSINKGGLLVEINFSVGTTEYTIRRGLQPNLFEIIVDNKVLDQDASVKEYQEKLEKNILKMNHKSFSQIVVLGTSTFIPFMDLPAAHRRNVIEDLLDIEIFTMMNSLLKERITSVKAIKREYETELKQTQLKLDLAKKHYTEISSSNQIHKNDIQHKINDAEERIKEHRFIIHHEKISCDELTDELVIKDKILAKSNQFKTIKTKLDSKVSRINKEIDFFEVNDDCPTCGQEIDLSFKKVAINRNNKIVKETDDALSQVSERLDDLAIKIAHMKVVQQQIMDINEVLISINSKIKTEDFHISDLKSQLINKDTANLAEKQKEIVELNSKLKKHKQSLAENSLQFNTMMHAAFLLKDGGIKTRIIKQYIPIMNKMINKYLAVMDFYCQFELDENFNETIKSRHRDIFSYHSFSEGEKMRINISLLFTWRYISKFRNSVSTNLLIMDEILDSSMDAAGTDDFIKILQTMTVGSNIFIISHKTDHILDKFDQVLEVTKNKNFSIIQKKT